MIASQYKTTNLSPKPTKSALATLALVMMINALAYGIIIPLLYPYASRFGIHPLGLSIMFASFSLAQFFSTPILGRLSDRHGRKPWLIVSLFGSSVALALFALATNFWMLLASRAVDGITGGNISIAQAMIADMTEGKDRAKAFGLLGASFGFGFLVGPAIGGLLSQISLTTPFWFASGLALFGTLCSMLFLKETVPPHTVVKKHEPLINFGLLLHALSSPVTGLILLVSLSVAIAQNSWIIGFQSFSVDVLKLSARNIGLIFAGAGFVNILMQGGGIPLLLKIFRTQQRVLVISLLISTVISAGLFFAGTPLLFIIGIFVYMIALAPQVPMVTALLSEKTSAEDQGVILGVNQSYVSLGQVIGPLLAGLVATVSTPAVFLVTASLMGTAWLLSIRLHLHARKVNI